MARIKRDIGLEILKGVREIKRGEHGRVINVPPITVIRENTGLSQSDSRNCSVFPCARFKNGSKGVVRRQGLPALFS